MREPHSSNSNVEFHHVITSITGSTVIYTLAIWLSKNSFWWPGVSVINTASFSCYMTVSFRIIKTSWNMYFLNFLCKTWSHGRHLVDSRIALFTESFTLPNVYALILSKLRIALMGFQRLGVAFHTQTAHECTQSRLNDVHPAWYVVSQCRPLNSGGLKGWLWIVSHHVIAGSGISSNSKYRAIGKLTMIKNIPQMYG